MRPLPTIATLALLSCAACAHEPDWHEVRTDAIEMRLDVNAIVEDIEPSAALIDTACALLGHDGAECKLLGTLWEVARRSIGAAQRAIDLYDATGIGLASTKAAIRRVREAADRFVVAVERVGEAVTNAVARNAGQGVQGARDGDRDRAPAGEGTSGAPPGQEPETAPPVLGIP